MRFRIFSILLLSLLPCFALKGQSFVEQLALSEQIKEQYGETDDRYLDALAGAIQVAFGEKNNVEANRLRLVHMGIVGKKYGETSLEYAEDLWRLGNVSAYKGEEYIINCYQKARQIYERNNAQMEYPYCDIMNRMYNHYYNLGQWQEAAYYLDRHSTLYEAWIGRKWKGISTSIIRLADDYCFLGRIYATKLQDFDSSNKACEKSVSVIEEYGLLTKYEVALLPYMLLADNNYELGNHKEFEIWQLRCISAAKKKISLIEEEHEEQGTSPITNPAYITTLEIYIDLLSDVIFPYFKNEDLQKVIEYAPELLEAYDKTGNTISSEYWETLFMLIVAYHYGNQFNEESALYSQFEQLSNSLDKETTESYISFLEMKATTLQKLYENEGHKETVSKWKTLTDTQYGVNSSESLRVSMNAATQYVSLDEMEDARCEVENCYKIVSSKEFSFDDATDSLSVMMAVHQIEGNIYYLSSETQRAKEKWLLSLKESGGAEDKSKSLLLYKIGYLFYEQGDAKSAFEYVEYARQILENGGDTFSTNYIEILNALAVCYLESGRISLSISILEEASGKMVDNYGKQDELYGIIEHNKSRFYAEIGDFFSGIRCCNNALECYRGIYGKDGEAYATCLMNLSCMYDRLQSPLGKDLLLEAVSILEQINSIECISAYANLATIYSRENDVAELNKLIKRAETKIEENNWGETVYVAFLYGVLAEIINDAEGLNRIKKALSIFETGNRLESKQYYNYLCRYCLLSFCDNLQTEDFIPRLLGLYKSMYLNDIAFLNSKERESLMSGAGSSRTKNILFSSRQSDKYDDLLYDFLLFNKGLLLSTSISYGKAVYNSEDADLIDKYRVLQDFNKFLSGENVELDGDYSFEEVKDKAAALEREITLWLRQNEGYTDELDYSYEDVRSALRDDEIAIEFVTYTDYTDTTGYYAALVAKKGHTLPEYVRLCKKGDLDKVVGQSPDKLYGETFVSQTAYDLIWTPLEPYLDSVVTVYYSPAGHINRMAVEHLHNGERYFDGTYNAVRLTSTREICNRALQCNYASAVLYGGLTYDEDDETLIAESRNVTGDNSGFRDRFRGFTDGVTRKGWNYLPGTLEEVNKISSVLADATINYNLYSSEKGNEESFKALSGAEFNILHIATHGFYMTETQAERSEFFSTLVMAKPSFSSFGTSSIDIQPLTTSSFTSSAFATGISPLQRSGLILSGGNRAWMGESIPDDVEDGILTASEVANLDFSRCDVVVLSACETGLGEITDEGVFGLQRAFKNAGVNTIIMSLWEVDDVATSLMMQTFYQNLVSGMTKREAFLAAQNVVREQHPDPRHWAAFIMLD